MTKVWGPLGWATLHSIAALYPHSPSDLERSMIIRWIDAFTKTIVCEKCKLHFTALFSEYVSRYPNWNASKKDMCLFALRAHNTVNARNSKITYSSEDALKLLRQNVIPEKAHMMRQSYILFIRRDWSRDTSLSGITAGRYLKEILMTETDYWSGLQFSWDEVEELIRNENIDSLEPAATHKTSRSFHLKNLSRYTPISNPEPITAPAPAPYKLLNITGSKPRFSFLSR
jgi:hypothetical protein